MGIGSGKNSHSKHVIVYQLHGVHNVVGCLFRICMLVVEHSPKVICFNCTDSDFSQYETSIEMVILVFGSYITGSTWLMHENVMAFFNPANEKCADN